MARNHIVVDMSTGEQSLVPYSPQEEADADALKAADDLTQAPLVADQQRRAALIADTDCQDLIAQAKTATNAQINTWLTNNVTSLAQARTVLGALIKIVAVRL